MKGPARTVLVFGVYLLLLGVALVVAPNLLLAVFGMPSTQEVWIRVVGMLVGILGTYYVQAARASLVAFFRWTVPVRASVILLFAAFVLLGLAPTALVLFGAVDLAGAAWTALALRSARDA